MLATSIIGVAGKILDKFIEDKDLKRKIEGEIRKETLAISQAQAQANLEQAKHPSLFVSGARPAIMWVCCLGIAWQYFIGPILTWIFAIWMPGVEPPRIELEGLLGLTMSLLGLGAMRSYEKSKCVARNNMK